MRSKGLFKLWNFLTMTEWRLARTIELSVKYMSMSGKIYFHCYESNKGARRVEISTTLRSFYYGDTPESVAKVTEIYNSRIRRWLDGRYDPEIPRYSEIPADDTANALKGTI